ncbi:aspartate dehydrogenase domain-containing protein [Candidatus Omnitrophota bacterium]
MVKRKKLKIGIAGCGAIGSRIAQAVVNNFKDKAEVTGLFDVVLEKSYELASTLEQKSIAALSLEDLIKKSNFIVEATSAKDSKEIARCAIEAGRDVMIMSIGGMAEAEDVLSLAREKKCSIYFPSGAIAGLDAVKAACLADISKITLTTRKPPHAFIGIPYLLKRKVNLDKIESETVLFEGSVEMATRLFPQNINVAAALGLASGIMNKVEIKIVTAPDYLSNSHEIELLGDFGRLVARTENVACPDNQKTSYLAVLSAIATLKGIVDEVKIGT